jgi:hypothetical protein
MRLRSERGDILVTPAVLVLGVIATLLVGGLTYTAARSVGGRTNDSRQGVTVDDEGNVSGGIGVAPMATSSTEPTEEPTQAPVVHRTATPTQQPIYVTQAPHETEEPYETDDPYETDEPDHDTPEPEDTMDPDDGQHPG